MQFHSKNFFKHTYCEFQQVDFDFSNVNQFKSKSGSKYHYTPTGVYRYSNHWGRVANCRWKLLGVKNYKNQNWYVGFANWSNFVDLTSVKKHFYITVDIKTKQINVQVENNTENSTRFLFSIQQALQRKKEIQQLLSEESWSKYFDEDIIVLREKILHQLINTNQSFFTIKSKLR